MKDYYKELSERIARIERRMDSPQFSGESSAIASKIDWAWKFRHITSNQKDELCDRMIEIFDTYTAIIKSGRKS